MRESPRPKQSSDRKPKPLASRSLWTGRDKRRGLSDYIPSRQKVPLHTLVNQLQLITAAESYLQRWICMLWSHGAAHLTLVDPLMVHNPPI